jgi:hypothetical protein
MRLIDPSYAITQRNSGASAADAADHACPIHHVQSDTEEPKINRPTLVKVGRRKVVRFARRLTVRGVVELVDDPVWINQVEDVEARKELGRIASAILGIGIEERDSLLEELAAGCFRVAPSEVWKARGSNAKRTNQPG